MAFWNRAPVDTSLPKDDRGSGSFHDYKYNLLPNNARTTLRLANSAPCQEELQRIIDSGESQLETAISRRSLEDGAGKRARIPASVQKTRGGWRVDLLVGQTR